MIQINLNHCAAAQNLLQQTAFEIGATLLLASEPYSPSTSRRWITSDNGLAAVISLDSTTNFTSAGTGKGFAAACLNKLLVIVVYCSPYEPITSLYETLDNISDVVRAYNTKVDGCLIVGDPNAWTKQCGSLMGESVVDVTLARRGIHVKDWRVDNRETLSDYMYLTYRITTRNPVNRHKYNNEFKKWATKKLKPNLFEAAFCSPTEFEDLTPLEEPLHRLTIASDAAMPRVISTARRRPAYWWSQEIVNARATWNSSRRKLTRLRMKANGTHKEDPINCTLNNATTKYRHNRSLLRNLIKASKGNC